MEKERTDHVIEWEKMETPAKRGQLGIIDLNH